MKQEVYVGSLTDPYFPIDYIKEAQLVLNNALVGEALAYNEFDLSYWSNVYISGLIYKPTNADGYLDINDKIYSIKPREYPDKLTHGTPIWYYVDDTLIGKFYSYKPTRENTQEFSLLAVSAVGMLAEQTHYGGLYRGETFQNVVAGIIGGAFPFSCTPDVAGISIFGWLPIGTKRDNLHQLLFATGVMLRSDSNGDMFFTFPDSETVKTVDPNRTYINGKVSPTTRVGKVRVTEHTYQQGLDDITYTLFDNTSEAVAEHQLISFSEAPCYDLVADGLTIEESGVNYAIVSGTGTLTGKAYTHIQKINEAETDLGGDTVKAFDEQTLVSVANSRNVLRRMVSYYSSAETVSESIQLDGERTGDLVTLTTPYKEVIDAYISKMTVKALATAKAETEFVKGYNPQYNGNNFTHVSEITSSATTFIVGANTYEIMVTLIGGGDGGQGGFDGEDGQIGTRFGSGNGGQGGQGGQGGSGGKVLTKIIPVSPYQVGTPVIGQGGSGGEHGGNMGSAGGATTFKIGGVTYTSADGVTPEDGFTNTFTGKTYARTGNKGLDGGNGGTNGSNNNLGYDGDSVTTETGVVYEGGKGCAGGKSKKGYWYGGAGGGATYANDGGDGGAGGSDSFGVNGGAGGAGADAVPSGDVGNNTGNGGRGGAGGGGGGGGGGATEYNNWAGDAAGGQGGTGAKGANGQTGRIIIYW